MREWLGAAVAVLLAMSDVAASSPPPAAYLDQLRRVETWARTGQVDSARVLTGELIRDARERGDRHALAYLLRVEGVLYVAFGQPRPAERPLREAAALSESVGDSAVLIESLRWLAVSLDGQGMRRESLAHWTRVFELASATGDSVSLGTALSAFAYDSLRTGRYEGARARYEEAIAVLSAAGALSSELNARLGLARTLPQLGEYDSTRVLLRGVAALAAKNGLRYDEANAWNNLGSLEYSLGDPGEAAACFRRSWELHTADGSVLPALTSMVNLAITESALGRFAEAESLLSAALDTSRREGLPAQEAQARTELGDLETMRGRWRAALSQYDAGLALGDRLESGDIADLAIGRARARIAIGDVERASRDLDEACLPIRNAITIELRLLLDAQRAELRLRLKDPEGALAVLGGGKLEADEDLPRLRLPMLVSAARAERMLGRVDRAEETLRVALKNWETDRRVPLDPEWRAQRTAAGRQLFAELLSLRLAARPAADADVVAAFDLLQRFKARTLRERMQRPDPERFPSALPAEETTYAEVQQALLDSEVLLDAFVGADESYLFAASRNLCRVTFLPGASELEPRVRLLVDFLAAKSTGDRPLMAAQDGARAMGALLLAGRDDDAAPSRILFSPDGALHRLPLALLEDARGETLLDRCDVIVIPSATILVDLRRRRAEDAAERGASGGVTVLKGPVTEAGTRLGGVDQEVRELRRRYQHVTVLADDAASEPARWAKDSPQVIHIAAHSVVDDERPWRSGVYLGSTSPETDPYLRAETIVGSETRARLVVLSSCTSAGGRASTGEGVEGLASAFLTGGAEVVVATLWPVEDRAAEALIRKFYEELARGTSAAGALRAAQQWMRRSHAWSDPFFWAGYVVIGNGATEIPLRRRPALLRSESWILGSALLVLVSTAILWRRSVSA